MTARPPSAAEAIRSARLLAILRGADVDRLADVAEVLVSEGIRALEFPIAGPEVLSVVSKVAARLGDTAYVGAGTVRNVADAQRAIDAGADFLVAPSMSMPVIGYARERGIGFVPGVFTPSEIDAATQAGAEVVKLFAHSEVPSATPTTVAGCRDHADRNDHPRNRPCLARRRSSRPRRRL